MVAGVAGRLAQLVDGDFGRRQVGVAEPEVDDVGALVAELDLQVVDDREDVGRQAVYPAELHQPKLTAPMGRSSDICHRLRRPGAFSGSVDGPSAHGLAYPPGMDGAPGTEGGPISPVAEARMSPGGRLRCGPRPQKPRRCGSSGRRCHRPGGGCGRFGCGCGRLGARRGHGSGGGCGRFGCGCGRLGARRGHGSGGGCGRFGCGRGCRLRSGVGR